MTAQGQDSEEVVLVLDSALDVDTVGEHHLLDAGDAWHDPTDRPYAWRDPGPAPARAVWSTLHGWLHG